MATNAKLSPAAGDILLIVGRVKGAFIFLSDRNAAISKCRDRTSRTISLVGGFYRQRRAANPRRQQE